MTTKSIPPKSGLGLSNKNGSHPRNQGKLQGLSIAGPPTTHTTPILLPSYSHKNPIRSMGMVWEAYGKSHYWGSLEKFLTKHHPTVPWFPQRLAVSRVHVKCLAKVWVIFFSLVWLGASEWPTKNERNKIKTSLTLVCIDNMIGKL